MNLIDCLLKEINRGFYKSELERLIGLSINSLSGIIAGNKKLSQKQKLKVENYFKQQVLPDPLDTFIQKKQKLDKKQDFTATSDDLPFLKPLVPDNNPPSSDKLSHLSILPAPDCSYLAILAAAKSGAAMEEIDIMVNRNGKINANQIAMIRSKIIT